MVSKRWILPAATGAAALAIVCFALTGVDLQNDGSMDLASSPSDGRAHTDAPEPEPPIPPRLLPATPEASILRTSVGADVGSGATYLEPVGRIRFDVMDPLAPSVQQKFDARFMSESRTADVVRTQFCDDTIPADRYEASIRVRGYEPIVIGDVEIRDDSTTDLGTLHLIRGSGRIRGSVQLYSLASDTPSKDRILVELRGDSRQRCVNCPESDSSADSGSNPSGVRTRHCPLCGFSEEFSLFQVMPGEEFTFTNLGSGHYRLRAWQPERDTLGVSTELMLASGEVRFVALRLLGTADLHLQFQYLETGTPFTGIETVDDVVRIHAFQFSITRDDGRALSLRYSPPIDAQRLGFSGRDPNAMLEIGSRLDAIALRRGKIVIGTSFLIGTPEPPNGHLLPTIRTRQRLRDDALVPIVRAPEGEPGPIGVEPGALANECVIRNLAAGHYSVRVTVGDRISDLLEVDVPSSGRSTLVVPLRIDPTRTPDTFIGEMIEIQGIRFSTPPTTSSIEIEFTDPSKDGH